MSGAELRTWGTWGAAGAPSHLATKVFVAQLDTVEPFFLRQLASYVPSDTRVPLWFPHMDTAQAGASGQLGQVRRPCRADFWELRRKGQLRPGFKREPGTVPCPCVTRAHDWHFTSPLPLVASYCPFQLCSGLAAQPCVTAMTAGLQDTGGHPWLPPCCPGPYPKLNFPHHVAKGPQSSSFWTSSHWSLEERV